MPVRKFLLYSPYSGVNINIGLADQFVYGNNILPSDDAQVICQKTLISTNNMTVPERMRQREKGASTVFSLAFRDNECIKSYGHYQKRDAGKSSTSIAIIFLSFSLTTFLPVSFSSPCLRIFLHTGVLHSIKKYNR